MVKSFAEAAAEYADLADDVRGEIRERTDDAGDRLRQTVENTVRRKDLKGAKRRLVRNVDLDAHTLTGDTVFASVVVAVPELYRYVEFGTGPRGTNDTVVSGRRPPYDAPASVPPYDPIYRWVVAKGITPNDPSITTQAQLAHAIRVSIMEEGTYARPFLRPSWHGANGYRNVRSSAREGLLDSVRRTARR